MTAAVEHQLEIGSRAVKTCYLSKPVNKMRSLRMMSTTQVVIVLAEIVDNNRCDIIFHILINIFIIMLSQATHNILFEASKRVK